MSNYELEIGPLLEREGGSVYTNHPDDKGGPTRWGITLNTLKAYRGKAVDANDVKNLTKAEAVEIYKKNYWDANRTSEINSQIVAKILFDQSVNRGIKTGAKIMQKAANKLPGDNIGEDGDVGHQTIGRVNSVSSIDLANEMIKEAQDQYIDIVKRNGSQIVFLAGWINRTQHLMDDLIIAAEMLFGGLNIPNKPSEPSPEPLPEPTPQHTRNERLLAFASNEIGIKEIPGSGSNPHIEAYHAYAREDNDLSKGQKDDVPWCASFVCYAKESVGIGSTNSMLAKSFLNWGGSTKNNPLPGDTVIFDRGGWKGHVGLLVDHNATHVWVLGGNQDNAVNVTKYSKDRMVDIRRSSKMPRPTPELKARLLRIGTDILNGNPVSLAGSMV